MTVRRWSLAVGVASALSIVMPTCWSAQNQAGLTIEPPALPLSCLTSAPKADLTYPPLVLPTDGGVVRVQMTFSASNAAPLAEVKSNSGNPSFSKAVLDHVGNYRLPCLQAGQSATAVQEFQFVGSKPEGQQVLVSETRYDDVDFFEKYACVVDGLGAEISFPNQLYQATPPPASIVVGITFVGSGQAPDVKILHDGGQARFVERVRDVVDHYRLRCEKPVTYPLTTRQVFDFRIDGEEPPQLQKAMSLQQLLGAVEDLGKYKVRFDLTAMSCPFQLTFAPFQPYSYNTVEADLHRHPERREFVEWLRQVVLPFPKKLMRTAIGSQSIVSVPCAVIDLT